MKLKILFLFVFLSFIPPEFIRFKYSNIWDFINIIKLLLYCILSYRVLGVKRKIKAPLYWLIIIEFWVLFSTIINNRPISEYLTWVNTIINITGIYMLFIITSAKGKFYVFCKFLYKYFRLIVFLNLLFAIIFPEGIAVSSIDNMWGTKTDHIIHMIGYKNNWFVWLFPYSLLSQIIQDKYKTNTTFDTFISIFSAIYSESSTCILSLILFYIVVYGRSFTIVRYFERLMTFWKVFFMALILNFSIVILRVQEIFAFIIEDILHKNLDFTERTVLWDQALFKILKSPFYGYGNGSNGKFLNLAGYEVPAHNLFLDITLQGGLLALLLFLVILVVTCKNISKISNIKMGILLNMAIFFMLIAGLMETYFSKNLFYVPLLLSYYIYKNNSLKINFCK